MDDDASLTVVGSEPEAELVCQLLRTEGIECFHRPTDYGAGVGDGLASGWGPHEVVVRPADVGRARELLAAKSES